MQPLKGARVLISGGTGFVGSHLARRLVSQQAKVFVLSRKGSPAWRLSDILPKITVCEGDIAAEKAVLKSVECAKPDFIFNVAAMRKIGRDILMLDSSVDVNLSGTLNFFKAIKKLNFPIQRFVQTGSMEEYGNGSVPYVETQREDPVSPYTASKVAATQFCQMLHRSLNYPIVVLRPCLIYGPYQSMDMFIPQLINACLKGEDFSMSSGEQTRDLSFVDDIINAFVLAAQRPEAIGEVINIGTGKEKRIKDVAQKIVEMTGGKTQLQFGQLPPRVGEIGCLVGDNSKAKALLGWSPKTNLDTGLAQTIEWYRTRMFKGKNKQV